MTNFGSPPYKPDEGKWIPTVCYMCFNACGIKAQVIDGVCVRIEGNPEHPHGQGRICAKGLSGPMRLYAPNRVLTPLKRTNPEKGIGVDPQWKKISWDEALDTICQKLKKILEDDPQKLVMCGIDYHAYVPNLAFISAFGTNNLWQGGTSYWCGQNVHGHTLMYGGGFFHEPDYRYCNYLLLIGVQYGGMVATNAVPLALENAEARARGMKLVVVDPICTNIAGKADQWIPIRPGTDGAFALGVANVLVNELHIYDEEFLKFRTNGPYLVKPDGHYVRDKESHKPLCWDTSGGKAIPFDSVEAANMALEGNYNVNGLDVKPAFQLLKEHLKQYPPARVSQITTIPEKTIKNVAREWGEAASIGSKIVIQGKELPLRPVACIWSKGAAQNYNAWHDGLAMELLNVLAGCIETPGGYLTNLPVGAFWAPDADPDGFLRGHPFVNYVGKHYPPRKVLPPRTLLLYELFPVAIYSDPAFEEAMLRPEKYNLKKPEMMINFLSDIMLNCGNPERIGYILKKFDFIVSFVNKLNATAEFADIVLPDTTYLERYDYTANCQGEFVLTGLSDWYWTLRQPVVKPRGEARPWIDVMVDVAERIGILAEYNQVMNSLFGLAGPYKLDLSKKYSTEQIAERVLEGGTNVKMNEYKEKGFIRYPKKVEEAYHFAFKENRYRVPVYCEFLIDAGKDVKEVTEKLGLTWNTFQFTPLPTWFPTIDYHEKPEGEYKEHDLYAVNYKVPTHTFASTIDDVCLAELGEYHPEHYAIKINAETAKRKGLKDGDTVWVESNAGWVDSEGKKRPPGKIKGKLKVVEGIHPECVGTAGNFGHWAKGETVGKGKGVHHNTLVPYDLKRIDPLSAALDNVIAVRIYKA